MTWTRRKFLISSATVSAGAVIIGGSIGPREPRPVTARPRLLISGSEVPSAPFERGVRTALGAAGVDLDAAVMPRHPDLARWRELKTFVGGDVVLGVASMSGFVLVNELIREAGAKLLYQGEHTVDGVGVVRHAWTTGTECAGVTSWLSHVPDRWLETLGFALGHVAIRRWDPGALPTAPFSSREVPPMNSSSVSFVFTV